MMRVAGFDPGLRVTGFGVILLNENYSASARCGKIEGCQVIQAGVIRVREKQDLSLRLKEIYLGVRQVLEESQSEQVAVEELYSHYRHPRTAILMAHARGLIFLAAAEKGIPVVSYSAKKIKQTLTGNGSASKFQVQRAIQGQLALAQIPEPEDVADALAVALCHINHCCRGEWHSPERK